jgi:hypothetical protein
MKVRDWNDPRLRPIGEAFAAEAYDLASELCSYGGLPKLAISLVGKGEPDDLVFAGHRGGKISGFSKLKSALDDASGGVCLHAQLRKEKAEALEAWAAALTRIVRPLRVVAS